MILCVVIEGALSLAHWDAIVECVHRCTPLISVTRHGRLFAGIDDLDALRALVQNAGIRAAMAPDRTSALLCAIQGTAGRLDAYANADDVPISALHHVPELALDELETERMRLFGMNTIGDLCRLSERHLRVQFGAVGARVYTFLNALHTPLQLYLPPPAITTRERFDESQCEPGILGAALNNCATHACMALAPRLCWRIELSVLNKADEPCVQRSRILRDGITSIEFILVHARALLLEMLSPTRRWWGLQLRLASLTPPRAVQTQLFIARKTAHDVSLAMLPRYASVMKRVEINNPWSIIPEQYSRIIGYTSDLQGNA